MELSIYNIITGPIISDKATDLNRTLNKLVLKVHPEANKSLVKQALEKLFNVEVTKVNILVRKGKNRRVRRGSTVAGSLEKKAIVTLAEGYALDFLDASKGSAEVRQAQEAVKREIKEQKK